MAGCEKLYQHIAEAHEILKADDRFFHASKNSRENIIDEGAIFRKLDDISADVSKTSKSAGIAVNLIKQVLEKATEDYGMYVGIDIGGGDAYWITLRGNVGPVSDKPLAQDLMDVARHTAGIIFVVRPERVFMQAEYNSQYIITLPDGTSDDAHQVINNLLNKAKEDDPTIYQKIAVPLLETVISQSNLSSQLPPFNLKD